MVAGNNPENEGFVPAVMFVNDGIVDEPATIHVWEELVSAGLWCAKQNVGLVAQEFPLQETDATPCTISLAGPENTADSQ